jgi:flagellar hook assembly protein FlgD
VNNLVVTDTLPTNVSFNGFVNEPFGTVTGWNSATNLIQWTLPSPLSPGAYQLTYQTKVDDFILANSPIVNRAVMNYPALSAPVTSSVPVTVAGSYTLRVNVYNAAGEIVRSITIQNVTAPVDSLTLTSNLISALSGTGSEVDAYFLGHLLGIWDGKSDNGNPVSNGEYQIKIDSVSPTGSVTTVTKSVMVNRGIATVAVNVYNSAGEVVRHLYTLADNPLSSTMSNVTLSSNVITPGLATASSQASVTIMVQDSGSPVTLVWDGTGDVGSVVSPGVYQVEVVWNDGKGTSSQISKSILVMSGSNVAQIVAKNNVMNATNGYTVKFDASGITNAYTVNASIYALSGELVTRKLMGVVGAQSVDWDASVNPKAASGLYVAVVEVLNAQGGTISTQRTKVLVTR